MTLTTHLAILQQSEYEWKRYVAWYDRHKDDKNEVAPKKKTVKFRVLFFLAGTASLFVPKVNAVQFALSAISWPESVVKTGILLAARAKLRYLQVRGLVVVGIAGSYAKTSTKHIMHQLLSPYIPTLATPDSVNTALGIAIAVLTRLTAKHKLFIAELGAYVAGDIADLVRYVRPKYGILTPLGTEHLERFGSLENVIAAESELMTTLPIDVLCCDTNTLLLPDSAKTSRVSYYGFFPNSAYDISNVSVTRAGTECILTVGDTPRKIFIPLYGKHNILNILPTFWVGEKLGISTEHVLAYTGTLKPVPHRMEPTLTENNVLILDNGYNTNPDSSKASLAVLEQVKAAKKVVVTPGFVEMGEKQYAYNIDFGKRIAGVADTVAVTGKTNRKAILEGLSAVKFPKKNIVLADNERHATKLLRKKLVPNSVILFEGGTPEVYQ